jgi:hypothetical protein
MQPSGGLSVKLQLVLAGLAGADDIDLKVGPALGVGLEPNHEDFTVIERQPELATVGGQRRFDNAAASQASERGGNSAEIGKRH